MAAAFLINMVRGTFGIILPGTAVDNASKVGLQIAASGGLLIPATNATVAAGAARAQELQAQGGNPEEMAQIMNAALDEAQEGAETQTFENGIASDTIAEVTGTAGVTADGVLLKDSEVTTDVIHEKTPTAGVTVDGLLIKDDTIGPAQAIAILDSLSLPLMNWREVDGNGDVGNLAAHGGLLASDSTPILRADAAESQEIEWAIANVDPLSQQVDLPVGFRGDVDVTLTLRVYTGNTNADPATFTVETGWDGGALVSDAATDGAPAAAEHDVVATILAADVPDAAERLTVALTPAAHATDPIAIVSARLDFSRTLTTTAA